MVGFHDRLIFEDKSRSELFRNYPFLLLARIQNSFPANHLTDYRRSGKIGGAVWFRSGDDAARVLHPLA
ncbi:hypothetical protein AMQ84_20725 [Paenibacillus riograndensis]|uniref:Uncharacterized protein n=1 Tax=Paenibacillus riograndensis TaxID=483937 RepID=A0A132TTC4_9BACL|nr:hypothetical protein AMQ84_20725 [Paenibacillus riograndensis]